MVEFPVLVTRLDGKEDVLVIQTYLVDAEVPFLCGKQTLESWNFKIDGREKILEIQLKSDQDCSRKLIRMVDTTGGHYGVVLEYYLWRTRRMIFAPSKPSGRSTK